MQLPSIYTDPEQIFKPLGTMSSSTTSWTRCRFMALLAMEQEPLPTTLGNLDLFFQAAAHFIEGAQEF